MPHAMRRLGSLGLVAGMLLVLSGCQSLGGNSESSEALPHSGVLPLVGLDKPVSLFYEPQHPLLIEGSSLHDVLFSLGYWDARTQATTLLRLRQMAEGQLAEQDGLSAVPLDRLFKAAQLRSLAEQRYQAASPLLKEMFEVYARGINAALYAQRQKLGAVSYWRAEDSMLLFSLVEFAWAGNFQQELAGLFLSGTGKISASQMAWLLPTYADEPLPETDVASLPNNVSWSALKPLLNALQTPELAGLLQATSVQWGVTAGQSSTQQPQLVGQLSALGDWQWRSALLSSPRYRAVGSGLPGIPLLFMGFNGKAAWSFSRSRGDSLDLRLERVRKQGTHAEYFSDGRWLPLREQLETLKVHEAPAQQEIFYHSPHGVLLTPLPESGEGMALVLPPLVSAATKVERSVQAWFALSQANSSVQIQEAVRELQAPAVNVMYADSRALTWQVTGQYPNRRSGRGLLPMPGWDEARYGWDGYANAMLLPYEQEPRTGWIVDAEQRSVPMGYGVQLSASWESSERADYLQNQLKNTRKISGATQKTLLEQQRFARMYAVANALKDPLLQPELERALGRLPTELQRSARQNWQQLQQGSSLNAQGMQLAQAFLDSLSQQVFADELGPETGEAWQAFQLLTTAGYSAPLDHLLGRLDSPFWDNRHTVAHETKAEVLAQTLAQMKTNNLLIKKDNSFSWLLDFSQSVPLQVRTGDGDWQPLPLSVRGEQRAPLLLTPSR